MGCYESRPDAQSGRIDHKKSASKEQGLSDLALERLNREIKLLKEVVVNN